MAFATRFVPFTKLNPEEKKTGLESSRPRYDSTTVIQVAATFTEDMGQVESKALEAMIQALGRKDGKIRLIYTGGVWLYGATGNSIANETTQFQPMPALAWMVETSEKLLHTQAFATAVIHPAMVYHQVGGAFSRFIDCAKQHKQIEIWKDGATRWPLIHRNDLAMAYRLLLEQPKLTGQCWTSKWHHRGYKRFATGNRPSPTSQPACKQTYGRNHGKQIKIPHHRAFLTPKCRALFGPNSGAKPV